MILKIPKNDVRTAKTSKKVVKTQSCKLPVKKRSIFEKKKEFAKNKESCNINRTNDQEYQNKLKQTQTMLLSNTNL